MIKALLIKGAEESLQYLENDIIMIQESFEQIGITVERATGNKFHILEMLSSIVDQLGSTDTLIVYYTGHGFLKKGRVIFQVGDERKSANHLSIIDLIEATTEAKTDNVILILDCCYATATEAFWKDYASDNHILFLPSSKLESVEELEEYKASFFTYCICSGIKSKQELLYTDDKITLDNLYNVTKENAIRYNKEKATNMPIPELFGGRRKQIVLGYRGENEKIEEKIDEYLNDFINCIEKCDKSCYEEKNWCSTIFKSDANIYQYVIPSVREFSLKPINNNILKLNAFFDNWFTDRDNYLGLLGDMGVGKTTACVYLFYYLAKRYNISGYRYVPVYFLLNGLNERIKKENNIYAVIQSFMDKRFMEKDIKELCRQKRIVFILDGFDEISGDSNISTILHNYSLLKPFMRFNCKTVLTCRTHYFSEQDQLEEVLMGKTQGTDFATALLNDEYPFNIVELQEFTESEILELIKILVPTRDNRKIWEEIGEVYDLRDLAKRAILLKMIVQTLPELQKNKQKIDSATLYSVYTKKLLRREIESRKIGLELSEKENFIGYIANLMYANNELTIQTHRFDKEIKQYFKNSVYSMDELNNYNYDCKVSTFFSRDQQDNYRFMHKSFYEYYFAFYCIQQMGEGKFDSWKIRWFPREIARFIKELLSNNKYMHLIPKVIQTSLEEKDDILIWNTLHIISLLDNVVVQKYLTQNMKDEYIKKGEKEEKSVIIRQYCRIIAKFIDRKKAEELIDKIICLVRNNKDENEDNDQTYYNYYGGKSAACQAFIRHLSVDNPKYDAKLHLYLLEHLATEDYADKIIQVTSKWNKREIYLTEINQAVNRIRQRNKALS